MANKFFETDDQIKEMVINKFKELGLEGCGIKLQVISTTKQKDVVKVVKTSEPTEFLTDTDHAIQIFIYEDVFINMLDDESQNFILEFALDSVWFNSDKDKVMIEKNPYQPLFNMRKKYGDRADELLESTYIAIKQHEDMIKE